MAGTLAELRSIALPISYPDIDPARVHVRLVEQSPALLAPYHPSLREYAHRQLRARGVDVLLDTTIHEITAGSGCLTAKNCAATSPCGPQASGHRNRLAAGTCRRARVAAS
jgi:NADH dehydrogenase FAD-containing subunit